MREDGFHELETLFYPLDEPADLITISPAPTGTGLSIESDIPGLAGGSNTMAGAWAAFAAATGFAPDLKVELKKGIPIGAGLGGGSSDAAALLQYLNDIAGSSALPREELMRTAATVGADVPFFFMHGPARGCGIGDRLAPASVDLAGLVGVLVCPPISVSTTKAYRDWDEFTARKPESSLTGLFRDITKINFSRAWLRNAFEKVVFSNHPEIRKIKERLLELGASGAVMSGSGSSVFAIFRERGRAEEVARSMADNGATAYVQEL